MITDEGCVVVPPGEGRPVKGVSGEPTLVKATGDQTGGVVAALEQTTPPNSGLLAAPLYEDFAADDGGGKW